MHKQKLCELRATSVSDARKLYFVIATFVNRNFRIRYFDCILALDVNLIKCKSKLNCLFYRIDSPISWFCNYLEMTVLICGFVVITQVKCALSRLLHLKMRVCCCCHLSDFLCRYYSLLLLIIV